MKILKLVQGSPEWIAARSRYFCASEAAAMMGLDPKLPRNELIRMKATGDGQEFSEWVQRNLLDKGHEIEASVRAALESGTGVTYYPVTGAEGRFLASFDGIDLDDTGKHGLEVKSKNATLIAAVNAGDLPDSHWPQVEQQIMVGELEDVLFVVSDGDPKSTDVALRYRSQPERRERLKAAWLQFADDVADYKPPLEGEVIPGSSVAAPTEAFPMPAVRVTGTMALAESNLKEVKTAMVAYVATIPAKPTTDQEFADCAAAVKKLKEFEDRCDVVRAQVIGQTASVADIVGLLDEMAATSKAARTKTNALVESRKKAVNAELIASGRERWEAYIAELNKTLPAGIVMPVIPTDFAGQLTSLKKYEAKKNAIDTHLANKKIEASAMHSRILINVKVKDELAADYPEAIPDLQSIITLDPEAFRDRVRVRVAEAKTAAEKRAEAASQQQVPVAPAPTAAAPASTVAALPHRGPRPSPGGLAGIAALPAPEPAVIIAIVAAHCHVSDATALGYLRAIDWNAQMVPLNVEHRMAGSLV